MSDCRVQVKALRRELTDVARRRATVSYRDLADRLGLPGPGRIRALAGLLERSMREDAAAGRPFLAVVVVSRETGMPRRGFFETASALSRFRDDPAGPGARAFFETEYRALRDTLN